MRISHIAAAVAVMSWLLPGPAAAARLKAGEPAPPFTLTGFDGSSITSDELRGQVVILNYWASWCIPCRQELPALDAYNRLHAGQGLRIFAVAAENKPPDPKRMPFAGSLSFPFVYRIRGSRLGRIEGVPTNYVLDRKGVIRWAEPGMLDARTLDRLVSPLLAEPAPAATP